jgi:CheY-like chemotaxis protein
VPTVASSGRQVLEILDRSLGGEFDVFILDAQMPEMDGTALAAAIRSRPEFEDVPIVMMNSGFAHATAGNGAPDEGIAWLNKPIRRTQLRACLAGLLTEHYSAPDRASQIRDRRSTDTAAAEGAAPLAIRRVLLVEDNPVNQEVALAMLQALGVEAVSAWSGEEALEKIAADRFEVVLMDCQMPRLDGYETTMRIRELEQAQQRSRMPIVALTANALRGDAEKCLAAGMDQYLSKPFTIQQLYAVLKPYATESPAERDGPAVAAEAQQDASAVLDLQTLERIRALHRPGGPNLLAKVVGIYLSSSQALIDALRAAASARNLPAILHAAHALRSSSANVGAVAFAELCRDLEAAAAAGDVDRVGAQVERLLADYREVLHALDQQTMAA